jgi:hypothetical protein
MIRLATTGSLHEGNIREELTEMSSFKHLNMRQLTQKGSRAIIKVHLYAAIKPYILADLWSNV